MGLKKSHSVILLTQKCPNIKFALKNHENALSKNKTKNNMI